MSLVFSVWCAGFIIKREHRARYYNSQLVCLEILACVMIMSASFRDLARWLPDSLSRPSVQSLDYLEQDKALACTLTHQSTTQVELVFELQFARQLSALRDHETPRAQDQPDEQIESFEHVHVCRLVRKQQSALNHEREHHRLGHRATIERMN